MKGGGWRQVERAEWSLPGVETLEMVFRGWVDVMMGRVGF